MSTKHDATSPLDYPTAERQAHEAARNVWRQPLACVPRADTTRVVEVPEHYLKPAVALTQAGVEAAAREADAAFQKAKAMAEGGRASVDLEAAEREQRWRSVNARKGDKWIAGRLATNSTPWDAA